MWNMSGRNTSSMSRYRPSRMSYTLSTVGSSWPHGGSTQNFCQGSARKHTVALWPTHCQPSPTCAGASSSGSTRTPRTRAYSTTSRIASGVYTCQSMQMRALCSNGQRPNSQSA